MRHKDLWKGIDALARRHDLTPSGLARLGRGARVRRAL